MTQLTLGPFELRERVGLGASAEVWRACHPGSGLPVALKILQPGAIAKEQAGILAREAQTIAQLNHPHIISLYDVGQISEAEAEASQSVFTAEQPYLVLQHAAGGSLAERGLPRRWASLRSLIEQTLDALAYAHARAVLHRDLKPANLLLLHPDSSREILLSDFGIATALQPSLDDEIAGWVSARDARYVGTPYYSAPEQILGRWRDFGPWTDLYALGCLVYHLTCGRPPFTADKSSAILRAHLQAERAPLQPRFPIPQGLERWLTRMIARDPGARFSSAAEAAWALAQLGPVPPMERRAPSEETNPDRPSLGRDTWTLSGTTWTWPGPWQAEQVDLAMAQVASLGLPLPERWGEPGAEPRQRLPIDVSLENGLRLYPLREQALVGRLPQRDALWAALHEVIEQQRPRLAILRARRGMGGSRLGEWTARRAAELGQTLSLRAAHGPLDAPLEAFAQLAQSALCAWGLQGSPLREHIRAWIQAREPSIDEPLLRYDCQSFTALLEPRPEAHFRAPGELYRSLERLLQLAAQRRALTLLLDDAQWAPQTLLWLEQLLERRQLPALVLLCVDEDSLEDRDNPLTRRTERLLETLGAGQKVLRLEIDALEPTQHRLLLEQHLPLHPRLLDNLQRLSTRGPAFAEQLLRLLIERGDLRADPEGFALHDGVDLDQGLGSMEEIAMRRLHRALAGSELDASLAALELAACLGLELLPQRWRQAMQERGYSPPDDLILRLLRAGLLRKRPRRLQFQPPALRVALLARAEEAGRLAAHHMACARMLQAQLKTIDPDSNQPMWDGLGQLAEHLARARQTRQAVERFLEAIHWSLDRDNAELAHYYLQRAETLLQADELAHSLWSDDSDDKAALTSQSGDLEDEAAPTSQSGAPDDEVALRSRSRPPQEERALPAQSDASEDGAARTPPSRPSAAPPTDADLVGARQQTMVFSHRAWLLQNHPQLFSDEERQASSARELLERAQAQVLQLLEQWERRDSGVSELKEEELEKLRSRHAQVLCQLGLVALHDDREQARLYLEHASRVAQRHQLPNVEATVSFYTAQVAIASGALHEARTILERALDQPPRATLLLRSSLRNLLASVLRHLEAHDEADAVLEEALALAESSDSLAAQAHCLSAIAVGARARGDIRRARNIQRRTLEILEHAGSSYSVAVARYNLARSEYDLHRPLRASELADRSAAGMRRSGAMLYHPLATLMQACALAALQRWEDACPLGIRAIEELETSDLILRDVLELTEELGRLAEVDIARDGEQADIAGLMGRARQMAAVQRQRLENAASGPEQ